MRPLNVQQPQKAVSRGNGALEVVDVFATIQGEGPLAGRPAVFVRLAGCNLQCPMCDTNYSSPLYGMTPAQLVGLIEEKRQQVPKAWLVVVTGGEPFRQNVGPFLRELDARLPKMSVQFETNGTLWPDMTTFEYSLLALSFIVCSPKTPRLNLELTKHVTDLKYVLSADAVDPTDGLPTSALGMTAPPARPWEGFAGDVYVQPCDDPDPAKNAANVRAAVESSMRFGYRLGLQMHKQVGLA